MLGIGRPVDVCCKISHPLQLLLETIQRPRVDGTMSLVENLDRNGRLGRRGKSRIGYIAEPI